MNWSVAIPASHMKEQRLRDKRGNKVTKPVLKPLIHLAPGQCWSPYRDSASSDHFSGFLLGPTVVRLSPFHTVWYSKARLIFLKLASDHVTPFLTSPTPCHSKVSTSWSNQVLAVLWVCFCILTVRPLKCFPPAFSSPPNTSIGSFTSSTDRECLVIPLQDLLPRGTTAPWAKHRLQKVARSKN